MSQQQYDKSDDGGPAFPLPLGTMNAAEWNQSGGMTLRDYFAAQALPVAWTAFEEGYFSPARDNINKEVAECAYQMADAMLKARKQ